MRAVMPPANAAHTAVAASHDRARVDTFMPRLSHMPSRPHPALPSAQALWLRLTAQLRRARLHYGHGTSNARDEAAALLWHVLRLPRQPSAARLRRAATEAQVRRLETLGAPRLDERVPGV